MKQKTFLHLPGSYSNRMGMLLFVLLLCCISPVKGQETADSTEAVESPFTEQQEEASPEEKQPSPFLNLGNADSLQLHNRKLGSGVQKRYAEDPDFWYANARLDKKQKTEIPAESVPYIPVFKRAWFKSLLWIVIIISFAAVLLYYLSDSHLGLFRRKRKIREEENITGEEMPEDIFAIPYDREIAKALTAGNYRMAVRLHYLRLLSRLAEKNIIRYQPDKTNFDYILQVQSTPLYTDFFQVTRHYEYSWYGHFEVTEPIFGLIRKDITKMEERI